VIIVLATSNTAVATVPSSVTLDAGQKIAPFTVATKEAGTAGSSGTQVVVSASYAGQIKTSSITVIQAPVLTSLEFSPSTVRRGNVSIARVRLSAAAPPGGAHVKLTSTNPSVAFPFQASSSFPPPASAIIPIQAGSSVGEIQVLGGVATGSINVPFSAIYSGVTQMANLWVTAVPVLEKVAFSVDNIAHISQNGTTVSATATLTSAPSDSYGDEKYINVRCESAYVGCSIVSPPNSTCSVIGKSSVGISVRITKPCPSGSTCQVVLHVEYKNTTKSDTLRVFP